MNVNLLLTIGLSITCALVVLFFVLGIARVLVKQNRNEQLHDLIDNLTKSEIALERKDNDLPEPNTWEGYWYYLAIAGGTKFDSKSTPGLLAIGIALFLFGVGTFVWPGDLIGGIIGAPVGIFFLRAFFVNKKNKRLKQMDKQLPNLLSGLRANLQANLTPQQAFINQAQEFPAPLGDELRVMVDEMSLGVTLDKALQNFAARVTSKEIKFLVASTRIAISSGADLDPQIAIIQRIVVERTQVSNLLAAAIAKAQPSIWVTGVMIPAGVLFSFYSSEENRTFWLSFPAGLIALLVVAVAYGIGLFIAHKLVDGIKKA